MRYLILILISIISFPLHAEVDRSAVHMGTVQELYEECNQTDYNFFRCAGVANGVMVVMALNRNVRGSVRMCTNDAVSSGQVIQAFKNWVQRNPQRWQENGVYGMSVAIAEIWPCE